MLNALNSLVSVHPTVHYFFDVYKQFLQYQILIIYYFYLNYLYYLHPFSLLRNNRKILKTCKYSIKFVCVILDVTTMFIWKIFLAIIIHWRKKFTITFNCRNLNLELWLISHFSLPRAILHDGALLLLTMDVGCKLAVSNYYS